MNKETLKQGIYLLGRQFPEKTIDAQILWEFVKDLTDEQYMKAVMDIVATQTDINRATNIIALIRDRALTRALPTAAEAYGEVQRAIVKIGSYGCPQFSIPIIRKTVDSIGWRNLCLSETPGVERGQFMRMYEAFLAREKDNVICEPLKALIGNTIHKMEHKDK